MSKKKRKAVVLEEGPFPKFEKPSEEEAEARYLELVSLHGEVSQLKDGGKSRSVLDSLVRTMLSQNTTDVTSARAFANLKNRFKSWEDVEKATVSQVAKEIKCCGLADIRAERIKHILDTLRMEQNEISLEYLRNLSTAEVKKKLCSFKGVGPKTAACVLMFCMQRAEFPVDTHVWRITKKLGWVPASANREQTYEHLNLKLPDRLKYGLHVLLVAHGKVCKKCAKNGKPRKPQIGPCPLTFPGSKKSSDSSKKSSPVSTKKSPVSTKKVPRISRKTKIRGYKREGPREFQGGNSSDDGGVVVSGEKTLDEVLESAAAEARKSGKLIEIE